MRRPRAPRPTRAPSAPHPAPQRVKASCAGKHASEALLLPLDVTAPASDLEAAAAEADAAFGGAGVDFLIHNAGASQHAQAAATDAAVSRTLLELNALGPIALTRAALPHMLARKRCAAGGPWG